jgi:hypothetical protein
MAGDLAGEYVRRLLDTHNPTEYHDAKTEEGYHEGQDIQQAIQ